MLAGSVFSIRCSDRSMFLFVSPLSSSLSATLEYCSRTDPGNYRSLPSQWAEIYGEF